MKLTEQSFLTYAMNHYDNPQCVDVIEFEEDVKKFQYLRKLLSRYKQDGELRERLILNHLIIVYNVFGSAATNLLFMKLEGYHSYLKPFVEYLHFMPEVIEYDNIVILSKNLESDPHIKKVLEGL